MGTWMQETSLSREKFAATATVSNVSRPQPLLRKQQDLGASSGTLSHPSAVFNFSSHGIFHAQPANEATQASQNNPSSSLVWPKHEDATSTTVPSSTSNIQTGNGRCRIRDETTYPSKSPNHDAACKLQLDDDMYPVFSFTATCMHTCLHT